MVMASHCYLIGPSGELFVEYLVRHCALSDQKKYVNESSKVGFDTVLSCTKNPSYHP